MQTLEFPQEIGPNKSSEVSPNERKSTGWAGPCAVFHVSGGTKQPEIGHFSPVKITTDNSDLRAFLEAATSKFGQQLNLVIRGTHKITRKTNSPDPSTRQAILDLLADIGISEDQVDAKWGNDNEQTCIVCDGDAAKPEILTKPVTLKKKRVHLPLAA